MVTKHFLPLTKPFRYMQSRCPRENAIGSKNRDVTRTSGNIRHPIRPGLMQRCFLATRSCYGAAQSAQALSPWRGSSMAARVLSPGAGRPLSTTACLFAKQVPSTTELEERISRIPIERFRNFCIVAHVDHGKSTLSDRLLELTGTIEAGGNKQILDKLDVERERGITVKAQTCSMIYNHNGADYLLHLVDTPGHVDFRAEVSRSYASCGGGK